MKIFRFEREGREAYGALDGEFLREVEGEITGEFVLKEERIPLSRVKLLPPVKPSKIVCIAYNFPEHASERGEEIPEEPVFFLKPPSSLISHLEPVIFPEDVKSLLFQGELGMVVGKRARNISPEEAGNYILGFTAVNDITAVIEGSPLFRWGRAKAYDSFTPAGPCLLLSSGERSFKIKTFVNAKLRQSASTSRMKFSPTFVLSYLSKIMTLEPMDLICLGTPGGVGPLRPEDRVDVQIEGIGTLSNQIIKEDDHENIP